MSKVKRIAKVYKGYNDSVKPIGGAIYYIDTSCNGEYKFYDKDVKPTDDLSKAVYYEIAKKGDSDKYFVADTKTGVIFPKRWGCYGISTEATFDGIGSGKINTEKALSKEDTGEYSDQTMWKYLVEEQNGKKTNGCDDWYIGSRSELDRLRESGKVDWFIDRNKNRKPWQKKKQNYEMWSSNEVNADNCFAWFWDPLKAKWFNWGKYEGKAVCFIRSF